MPRRNIGKERIVVRKGEDMFKLIEDLRAYSFIPDIHLYGATYPDIAVLDIDPSPRVPYWHLRDFTQEFFDWLIDFGFEPKLRRTGGRGFHIILEMEYYKIPKLYPPFSRTLRFNTLYDRIGTKGLLWLSFADFLKTLVLGFAVERKRKGKGLE
jgi:hypothetical protein